jgi:hypothetical protein
MVDLSIFKDSDLLNVRFPLSFSVTHRVADTVPTHRLFTTIIAFGHDEVPYSKFSTKGRNISVAATMRYNTMQWGNRQTRGSS